MPSTPSTTRRTRRCWRYATGRVDFLLNPLGLQRGLQSTVLEAGDLDVIANSSNGFRYLAFNTRSFPGSDVAFRQAMACMIDKEFMATNVLQGVAIPLNSMVPPGNAFWANPDLDAWCAGQSQEERVNSAVQILKDAGWTVGLSSRSGTPTTGDVIPKGEGLRGPDGTLVGRSRVAGPRARIRPAAGNVQPVHRRLGQRPRDTADGGAHRLLGDRGQGVRAGGLGHVHPRDGVSPSSRTTLPTSSTRGPTPPPPAGSTSPATPTRSSTRWRTG